MLLLCCQVKWNQLIIRSELRDTAFLIQTILLTARGRYSDITDAWTFSIVYRQDLSMLQYNKQTTNLSQFPTCATKFTMSQTLWTYSTMLTLKMPLLYDIMPLFIPTNLKDSKLKYKFLHIFYSLLFFRN